jgi:serine/threonine-protein kinase
MATVYHGIDERLERTVAIKIIHPTHAGSRQFTDRFEREAKMIARLAHPNIVAVYDEGSHGGLPYLVMEYVHGRTLRDVLNERRRLPPAEALDVMALVLAALAAAHRAGLVHRDVKPENVLLSDDGQIKVADFGLASAVEASGEDSTGGQLLATVAYVAPELVSRGHADPRADVYSAGIMLFELLTSQVPYDGDKPVEIAWQHVEQDVPSPSVYIPETPAALDELVARATRRDPGARPTDAGALLAELIAVREDLSAPAQYRGIAQNPPPRHTDRISQTTLIPVARRPRRRPPFAVIAALITMVLCAAIGGWWFGAGRYTETPGLLTLTRAEAQTQAAQAGFFIKTVSDFSETAPIDTVIAQHPKPKASILRGGTITVTVSKGPERHAIPAEIIGMDTDRAMKVLQELTLKAHQSQKYDTEIPADKVIGVDPPVGTLLPPGTAVSLTISKGPPPIMIPRVVGKNADDARRELEGLGLTIRIEIQDNEQTPKDKVISQNPAEGTGTEKGTVVNLVVSAGPPMVTVPDVGGLSFDEARKTLEAAGLGATRAFNWPGGRNTVYTQSPGAHQQAPKGSTVSLWIY